MAIWPLSRQYPLLGNDKQVYWETRIDKARSTDRARPDEQANWGRDWTSWTVGYSGLYSRVSRWESDVSGGRGRHIVPVIKVEVNQIERNDKFVWVSCWFPVVLILTSKPVRQHVPPKRRSISKLQMLQIRISCSSELPLWESQVQHRRSRFNYRVGQYYLPLHRVHTGSGVHSPGRLFPWG
jgi:hypothetical protein